MADRLTMTATLIDEAGLSVEDLCRVASVRPDWVVERVQAGLLAVRGDEMVHWRFDTVTLRRVRSMVQLERDFDAVPELAALVADLQGELAELRHRLRRAGV